MLRASNVTGDSDVSAQCSRCGSRLSWTANVCPKCGAWVPEPGKANR